MRQIGDEKVMLHLAVQPLARAHQINSVIELGVALGRSRQGLYPVWDGTARSITLPILTVIACRFRAAPGDWFAWTGAPFESELRLDIRHQAELRNVGKSQLGFAAALHSRSVDLLWAPKPDKHSINVYLNTCAKIYRVLNTQEQPFDIGQIFSWERVSSTDVGERGRLGGSDATPTDAALAPAAF